MANLPVGTIVLIIISSLIYFGLAHRILEKHLLPLVGRERWILM